MKGKEEVIVALELTIASVVEFVAGLTVEQAKFRAEGKWSVLQNLDHLVKSTTPLNRIMPKPKFILWWMFGKSNREGKTYDQLMARYNERLGQTTGTPPSSFAPSNAIDKKELVMVYEKESKKLISILSKWNEEQLDKYILPHPLLGKVTVREMMFFTNCHTLHHLEIMKLIGSSL